MTRVAQHEAQSSMLNAQFSILAAMALGLALFYWGGALALAAAGLLIFGALALMRPDLGLLFVPLTAPLYLIPAALPGLRGDPSKPFMVPVHEAALLVVAAATAAGWGWGFIKSREPRGKYRIMPAALLREYSPQLLFLAAGIWGVLIAIARGPALIEFRRLIAEPLLFYVLLKLLGTRRKAQGPSSSLASMPWVLMAFVLGGALVGLLGLLQYVGVDLVPYFGAKQCFAPDGGVCSNIVVDGGVRRVLSVYGHPNNLGLYLGRVWPLAAALALADQGRKTKDQGWHLLVFGLSSLVCLGGIVVSFSRGAWLGALAALAVLGLPFLRARFGERAAPAVVAFGVVLAALAGLGLTVRGDVGGGSTPVRLLLWREAIGYIRLHPLGIGLDQFVQYHDPNSGRSLIDPSLIGTSEQYAAHPHNLLLDIWLRLGPLGLAAFGWLLARFFGAARVRLHDPLVLGALAAMTAALVHGLVDNFYFVPDLALAFWLLIALVEYRYERMQRYAEPSPADTRAQAR
ncbi:MAG TPA: O-antigen ligase family protein [Roseiflexaceae bacterium]|nr:O-antigen ligase family protein [Roseiflexaceae bacterium]